MTRTLHRPLVPLALSMTLALTLSACSQDPPAAFEEGTTNASQAGAEPAGDGGTTDAAADDGTDDVEPDAGSEGADPGAGAGETEGPDDVTARSAEAAGVDLSTVEEPIASATVAATVVGDPEATMEVNLHSLVRDGKTVFGTFSFVVHSEAGTDEAQTLWQYFNRKSGVWRPYLIDTQNLTRHAVLSGPAFGNPLITEDNTLGFRPGQTFFAYAAFAAPPADVTTVSVSLIDGSPVAAEVPIR